MSKSSLVGLDVKIFLDKYEVEGTISSIDEEKVIVDCNGPVYLIYKDKINMVLLNPGETLTQEVDQDNSNEYYSRVEPGEMPHGDPESFVNRFVQNGVAEQNQYANFIPRTIFEKEPPAIEDLLMGGGTPDVDLSISASILNSEEALLARAQRNKIKEKNGTDEETRED